MRILFSAYACEPHKGSEPSVGWNWALETARLGHEVWVLTRANNQRTIEDELSKLPSITNLNFLYYDLPPWLGWWKKGGRGIYLYYLLWQWGAYRLASQVHKREKFERVHHITFGSIRLPSFMGRLGVPFVFGPVGGGETAPWKLRMGYGLKGWIWDALRDISNLAIRFDPLMQATFRQAQTIYVKTLQSRNVIPKKYWGKVKCNFEIGIDDKKIPKCRKDNTNGKKPFRILYVGRFLYLKGMHLGLAAFARLLTTLPDARLTLVGDGPDKRRWHRIADKLNVSQNIDWVSWIPQSELFPLYQSHDVFLFPSLHDSSGNVILEAMICGLPIICLDLGGPGEMVDNDIGHVIPTGGQTESQVSSAIAAALIQCAENPQLWRQLGVRAKNKVKRLTWSSTVSRLYEEQNRKDQELAQMEKPL